MPRDPLTLEIYWLTRAVHVTRVAMERLRREQEMALELKGLKGKAITAAGHIDRLNRAYDSFNEAAPAHASDVEGMTTQVGGMHEDLTFATQVLGNSVGASNGGGEEKKPEEKQEQRSPILAVPDQVDNDIRPGAIVLVDAPDAGIKQIGEGISNPLSNGSSAPGEPVNG